MPRFPNVAIVPIQGGCIQLHLANIAYAMVHNTLLHVYMVNSTTGRIEPEPIIMPRNLQELLKQLPNNHLVQVSRSVAIRPSLVCGYHNDYGITLSCGQHTQLHVGHSFIPALRLTMAWMQPKREEK